MNFLLQNTQARNSGSIFGDMVRDCIPHFFEAGFHMANLILSHFPSWREFCVLLCIAGSTSLFHGFKRTRHYHAASANAWQAHAHHRHPFPNCLTPTPG